MFDRKRLRSNWDAPVVVLVVVRMVLVAVLVVLVVVVEVLVVV